MTSERTLRARTPVNETDDYPFDLGLLVVRGQIWHPQHLRLALAAAAQSSTLLILLGSAFKAPDPRDPFPADFREAMIRASLPADIGDRVRFAYQIDILYNLDRWIADVNQHIARTLADVGKNPRMARPRVSRTTKREAWHISDARKASTIAFNNDDVAAGRSKVAIFGYEKDDTSFYLRSFHNLEFISIDCEHPISATDLRMPMILAYDTYKADPARFVEDYAGKLHPGVIDFLQANFIGTPAHAHLAAEARAAAEREAPYEALRRAGLPVIHYRASMMVTQAGHILLARRKDRPGKGLWELPGVPVADATWPLDAALQAVKDLTGIRVPTASLKGSVVAQQVFAHPRRVYGRREINHCFLARLIEGDEMPVVRGSDHVEEAALVPRADIVPEMLADDTWQIIQTLDGHPDARRL